jgi:PAS domain S-box-containing protein
MNEWVKSFQGGITVCDEHGIVLEMNEAAEKSFEKDGGRALIGKNLLDCHPPEARQKLEELMRERKANVYTIEKQGRKKLIYQTPWYQDGRYAGFIELSLVIPFEMPHFVRD